MIDKKVDFLFSNNCEQAARVQKSLCRFWLRGTEQYAKSEKEKQIRNISDLKRSLFWNEELDDTWRDRFNMSILIYAVLLDEPTLVDEILTFFDASELLNHRMPKKGLPELGLPGKSLAIHIAMGVANVETVRTLLKFGSHVSQSLDAMSNDALMMSCVTGNIKNIQFWFETFPKWDINRKNAYGSPAIHFAAFLGRSKLDLIRYLVEKMNADVNVTNNLGNNTLILAAKNEDCDPKVVRYLLEKVDVNVQIVSQSISWKITRFISRLVVRSKLSRSKLLRRVADSGGLTALHYAARRGDVAIVELLLGSGAKLSIKNDLGKDVFVYCKDFPEIENAIRRLHREAFRNNNNNLTTCVSRQGMFC